MKIMTSNTKQKFHILAQAAAGWVGSPIAFGVSVMGIMIWALMGPIFHYSDTWQLIVNTTTTIITFLAVFLIQNTQNRDAKAIHLKLDELIRANVHARNHLIDLQNLSDEEMDRLHEEFCQVQRVTNEKIEQINSRRKVKRHGV